MFAYGPQSYNFQTWSTAGDGNYLLDNDAWATNLMSHKLAHMAGRADPDDPSPIRAASPASLASSAVPLSPAHSPSRSHCRTPIYETKKKGLALALHPAPTPRRPNLIPWLPLMVKMVMTATQHPKRATSLKRKMKKTLTVEPQMIVKAQMAAALMRMVLVTVAKFPTLMARMKTLTGKLINPTVRLKSQVLKAAPALPNPMMPKQPLPMKKTSGSNPNTYQMLSLPNLDSKDLKEE